MKGDGLGDAEASHWLSEHDPDQETAAQAL